MVDILYSAKKLRHKFAKVLHNAEQQCGKYLLGGSASTAVLTAALVGGGLATQESPETLVPDTDAAPQAIQLAESFKSEIFSLAEDRAAFLAMKQESVFTSNGELPDVKQTGNGTVQRAEQMNFIQKFSYTMILSLITGVGGGLCSSLLLIGAISAGNTRTVRRWAENKPKPKKPFLGH